MTTLTLPRRPGRRLAEPEHHAGHSTEDTRHPGPDGRRRAGRGERRRVEARRRAQSLAAERRARPVRRRHVRRRLGQLGAEHQELPVQVAGRHQGQRVDQVLARADDQVRGRLHTLVDHERARFAGARVHAFVPILVERAVRASLAAS
ncbi:three-helix bundle dimerization domain-containing protein [Amycolatopsis nalaikhensis]|uniref:three-helix bundle dimerization domain-containing protein n=1 Tax=Amycolatopsis nalaikhensis TaxID=715472 RepID=UPI003D9FE8E7